MLLKLLERLGRKAILVDFYGRVLMERWYLFYYEEEAKPSRLMWLPNVWLHYFPGPDSPDGEDLHRHPHSTLSVLLKGGYTEIVNGIKRAHKLFAYLSYKDSHRIDTVIPNTWTLFMHGFRKQPWTFDSKVCDVPCQACGELNNSVCFKTPATLSYNEQFSRGDGAVKWERVGKNTYRQLELRRKAIARKGLPVPSSKEEGRYIMKKRLIDEANR